MKKFLNLQKKSKKKNVIILFSKIIPLKYYIQ